MASDERHASVDFEIVPDLVCGRSYRNPESEALAVAMRAGEVTPYTGCGKPLRWVYAYRCRQCGRWLHGPCMDRHFGGIDLTAELAAAQARAERAEAALRRSKRWLEGAEETFEASLDCGEDDHQATGECVRGDSYCERARDMRRGIAEIDAALAAAPEARDGE